MSIFAQFGSAFTTCSRIHRWSSTSSYLQQCRQASLNSAVERGLRRSQGVGFRGKERTQNAGDTSQKRNSAVAFTSVRRTAEPLVTAGRAGLSPTWKPDSVLRQNLFEADTRARILRGKKDVSDSDPGLKRSRAARYNDPNSSFGRKSLERRMERDRERESSLSTRPKYGDRDLSLRDRPRRPEPTSGRSYTKWDGIRDGIKSRTGYSWTERVEHRPSDASLRAAESDRNERLRNPAGSKMSPSRLAYLERSAQQKPSQPAGQDWSDRSRSGTQGRGPRMGQRDFTDRRSTQTDGDSQRSGSFATPKSGDPSLRSIFTQTRDSRLPLSVPYTTPASEFLYGQSVVTAALKSQSTPSRKLYKLYVYSGTNRERSAQDSSIEQLARKKRIELVRVPTEGIRLMDKMSEGRPHNGYILEASPLPKLPVVSLGDVVENDGVSGFEVVVDYQSREEAAVNGTENFISVPRDTKGRKPFVLLLDSIQDPGNLGGIIRTASFMGVSAVGISTRNSATFTPVVLKASAGASENVVLFSVAKPAQFVADSKLAGWKVYAAVAPSRRHDSNMPPQVSTTTLGAPLQEGPCILMIGNEGEGLRFNLRSHANVDISIDGGSRRTGVDSLNVSVATGILCDAFLREKPQAATSENTGKRSAEEPQQRDLF